MIQLQIWAARNSHHPFITPKRRSDEVPYIKIHNETTTNIEPSSILAYDSSWLLSQDFFWFLVIPYDSLWFCMIARWNSSRDHQVAILIMKCSQGLTFQGSPSTFKIPQIDKNNLGDHSTFSKDRHQQIKPNRKIPPKFPSTKPIFIILPKKRTRFFQLCPTGVIILPSQTRHKKQAKSLKITLHLPCRIPKKDG